MRAAIYARRSQKHQDASVRTQIEEATRFITSRGWTLVETYPDDDKNTGRKEFVKRREFLRLLADAEEGRFDVVVARDLTRLGGDTSRTMRAIEDLTEAGIEVWYYIENRQVTLTTAMDKIMFAVQSGTSEAERDGISSRVFEALMVRARKAQNVGGRVYGYSNVPIIEGEKRVRTEYAINEEQAGVVREIFSMYADGKGLRGVAIELNTRGIPSPSAGKRGTGLWSSSALYSMLRRERYRGKIVYGAKRKTYRKGTKVRVPRDPSELTLSLFARPSSFDGGDDLLAGCGGRKIRQVVLSVAVTESLAHEPCRVSRQVNTIFGFVAVGGSDADDREFSVERPLGSLSPGHPTERPVVFDESLGRAWERSNLWMDTRSS